VFRSVITIGHVLEEPEEWKGNYIPIVPLVGEEIRIGRRIVRRGIIRNAKDGQRLYNISRSSQAEVINDAPKSPWVGTDKNFREYEAEWSEANRKRWPYLRYTPDPLNSGQAPQRSAGAHLSSALSEAVQLADQDMMALMGIHQAGLGNDRTRRAASRSAPASKRATSGRRLWRQPRARDPPHGRDYRRPHSARLRHRARRSGSSQRRQTEMVTINKAVYRGELDEEEPSSDYLDDGAEPDEEPLEDSSGLDMATRDRGGERADRPTGRQRAQRRNARLLHRRPRHGAELLDRSRRGAGRYAGSYDGGAGRRSAHSRPVRAGAELAGGERNRRPHRRDTPAADTGANRREEKEPRRNPARGPGSAAGTATGQPGQAPGAAPGRPPGPPLPTPEQLQQIVEQQVEQRADVVKEQAATERERLSLEIKKLDVRRAEIALQEKEAEAAAHQAQAAGMPDTAAAIGEHAAAFKHLATELAHQRGMIEEIVSQLPHPERSTATRRTTARRRSRASNRRRVPVRKICRRLRRLKSFA
jgi:hypothetical protein